METFSALLAICVENSPVPGEFSTQRPVTRSFDVYFDLRPNKGLSKQLWGWWFETQLWRHRNEFWTRHRNEFWNIWISNKISMKFIPNFAFINKKALASIMAWCWIGDKPLSEPMMAKFTDAPLGPDVSTLWAYPSVTKGSPHNRPVMWSFEGFLQCQFE